MNNYILDYYQAIINGDVVVGTYVRKCYEMIIKGLEEHEFVFSQKKANLAITFIENFCRHHEGVLAPKRIKLELWQKAFISIIFGIVDEEGTRWFREILLIIGRKNGKTLLAAAISAYCAFMSPSVDGEYGQRIYYCAPKLEQANLCYDAFYQMIRKEPELDALAKRRRSDIYIAESNSTAKPIAFNAKKSDGLNISLAVADEVASWAGENGLRFYEVLKSSQGSRKAPLLLNISTAGYENDSIYDELMKRATRVLKGDSKEKRLLPMLYMIDDVSKWNDISELRKSNPNLGVSISVNYLLEEIAVAEGSISKKREFIVKYANIKQNASSAWLEYETVSKCCGEPLHLEDFRNCYCVVGVDLSQTTDLTAVTCLIEKGGHLYTFAHFFLPREKIEEATIKDNVPYYAYMERGFLSLSGDNFIDYNDCFRWIKDLVEKYKIYPLEVGYDRYSSQYLIQQLETYGFHCDDVYQGTNLYGVLQEMEGLMKDGKVHIGDNDLLKMHLLNSAIKMVVEQGRGKLVKIAPTEHIDGTAALADAFCVRQKWFSEYGARLQNVSIR